jgi:1-acyl-sn-glycerol-3-phosphate acyltransferase
MGDPGTPKVFQLSILTRVRHFSPMLQTVVVAIRSVLTYVAILIYIAFAAPLALVAGVVFRWKGGMFLLGHGGVGLALATAGIRYRVKGTRPPVGSPVVFCSNHESNVDPPVLFRALHPRLHILYKAELHNFPLMGTVLDVGGFVPIDRKDRHKSFEALERGASSLRAGNSFLIFPEGTRSWTGHLQPFKKGGFLMAIQAQVPVVPVAISGGRESMRKGSAFVRPVRVSVRLGQAIPTAGMAAGQRDVLIDRVRAEIERLLEEGPTWS